MQHILKAKDEQFYVVTVDRIGRVLQVSETMKSKQGAITNAKAVIRNVSDKIILDSTKKKHKIVKKRLIISE